MPGSFQVLSPTETASDATTKNQPPDIDIMVFHTRPGVANGTPSRQKRGQALRRERSAAPARPVGAVHSDWNRLNSMFHAWLVKIAKIAASSTPITLPGNSCMK